MNNLDYEKGLNFEWTMYEILEWLRYVVINHSELFKLILIKEIWSHEAAKAKAVWVYR